MFQALLSGAYRVFENRCGNHFFFHVVSGQELRPGKLVAGAADEDAAGQIQETVICGRALPVKRAFRLAGGQLATRGTDDPSLMDSHVTEAITRLRRALWLPVPFEQQAEVAHAIAASMVGAGSDLGGHSRAEINGHCRTLFAAIMLDERKWTRQRVLLGLVVEGPLMDPATLSQREGMLSVRRQILRVPLLKSYVGDLRDYVQDVQHAPPGPVRTCARMLGQLRRLWPKFDTLETDLGLAP